MTSFYWCSKLKCTSWIAYRRSLQVHRNHPLLEPEMVLRHSKDGPTETVHCRNWKNIQPFTRSKWSFSKSSFTLSCAHPSLCGDGCAKIKMGWIKQLILLLLLLQKKMGFVSLWLWNMFCYPGTLCATFSYFEKELATEFRF